MATAASPPELTTSFSFKVDYKKWESLVATGKAVPDRKGFTFLGKGWRSLMLAPIEKANKLCLIDRNFATPRISCWLKCKRDTVKGAKCDVKYKISRNEAPDNEESVEFLVVLVSGDVLESHYEDCGTTTFAKSYTTGDSRKEMKDLIRESKKSITELVQDFSKEAAEDGALLSGNLTPALSYSAVRHMVRELREEDVRDPCVIRELIIWQEEMESANDASSNPNTTQGFLQELIHRPFGAILYSSDSVRLGSAILRSVHSRVYSDATGGVTRKVNGKEVFLYIVIMEAVGQPDLNLKCPIQSFLSTRHDTERIRHSFSLFFSAIQKRVAGDFLVPTEAVCDYSLPILRAYSLVFNGFRLWEYINFVWEVVDGRKTAEQIRTKCGLHCCSLHGLKAFPIPIGRRKEEWERNTELRKMFAILLMSETLNRLASLLQLFAFILQSPFYTQDVLDAIEHFQEYAEFSGEVMEVDIREMQTKESEAGLKSAEWWEDSIVEDPEKIYDPATFHLPQDQPDPMDKAYTASTQRDRSPFYNKLIPFIQKGRQLAIGDALGKARGTHINPYHLPGLVNHLEEHFISHAPLFTQIYRYPLRYASDISTDQCPTVIGLIVPLTNNAAESAFASIKSIDTKRDSSSIRVYTPRSAPLRLQQLAQNLLSRLERRVEDLKQTKKTGLGPLYSIAPNKRRQKKKEEEEEEEDEEEDEEEEKEEPSPSRAQPEPKTRKTEEVGDDAAVEDWGGMGGGTVPQVSPNKKIAGTPKKTTATSAKFLTLETKLTPLKPTKIASQPSDLATNPRNTHLNAARDLDEEDLSRSELSHFLCEVPLLLPLSTNEDTPEIPRRVVIAPSQPARTRKAPRPMEASWNGHYPAPETHTDTRLVGVVWGQMAPGPQSHRTESSNTCSSDNILSLLLREELESKGQISRCLKASGRRVLGESVSEMARGGDGFWAGTDAWRRDMATLSGITPIKGKLDLHGSERDAFLAIANCHSNVNTSVSCKCGVRQEPISVPMLSVFSPHARLSIPEQLGIQTNLDLPHHLCCTTCGEHYKKLEIYMNQMKNSFMVALEVTAMDAMGVQLAWLQLPRTLAIGSRTFILGGLTVNRGQDHYLCLLRHRTDRTDQNSYAYNGLARPSVSKVHHEKFFRDSLDSNGKTVGLQGSLAIYFDV